MVNANKNNKINNPDPSLTKEIRNKNILQQG